MDSHQELHREPSLEHTDSEREVSPTDTEPNEELKTEEDVEKENVEDNENLEKKENPQIARNIGVPVMGMGLMAEMKARQERMAVKKVGETQPSTFVIVFINHLQAKYWYQESG